MADLPLPLPVITYPRPANCDAALAVRAGDADGGCAASLYLSLLPAELRTYIDTLIAVNSWRTTGNLWHVTQPQVSDQRSVAFTRTVLASGEDLLIRETSSTPPLFTMNAETRQVIQQTLPGSPMTADEPRHLIMQIAPATTAPPLSLPRSTFPYVEIPGTNIRYTVMDSDPVSIDWPASGFAPRLITVSTLPGKQIAQLTVSNDFDVSYGWLRSGPTLWHLPLLSRSVPLPAARAHLPATAPYSPFTSRPDGPSLDTWLFNGSTGRERLLLSVSEHGKAPRVEVWDIASGALMRAIVSPVVVPRAVWAVFTRLDLAVYQPSFEDTASCEIYSLSTGDLIQRMPAGLRFQSYLSQAQETQPLCFYSRMQLNYWHPERADQFVSFAVEGFTPVATFAEVWQLYNAQHQHVLLYHFRSRRGFIVPTTEWKSLESVTFHAGGAFFAVAQEAPPPATSITFDLYFAPVVQIPSNGDLSAVPRLTLADLLSLGTVTESASLVFVCPMGSAGKHHPPLVAPAYSRRRRTGFSILHNYSGIV